MAFSLPLSLLFALSILMLLFSNDVRTTVEGESIARTTSNVIFFSLLLALVFSMLNHRRLETKKKKKKKERERICPMYICCFRSEEKRKRKKNERNMHNRFDNQLEAAAFNISPNERESLFAIQLVKYTIQ
jgi:glucan phosphoethanolaminetransferase (alkaline phosphatase superfamily)